MLEQIFCFRSFFVFVLRLGLLTACLLVLTLGVRAQDITPSPTPTVTPTPAPTETPTATPDIVETNTPADAQKVQPESVQGVPQIAPEYRFESRELPEIGRVGVDMMQPRPLSLRDALELALTNNKDIEVARQTVRVTEFDLSAARGVYQPRFFGQSFYERSTTPSASFFTGGADGKLTSSSFTNNLQLQGQEERFGGNYSVQFNNSRVTSSNPFNTLNPQFVSGLNLQYNQPLFRGRRFDQNRRIIEITKKNLSLNDAQFRQRTIEVITNVQRAYWDLTFALKNLQVQRDAVRDAKEQLAHNQRLVDEGILAPIDVVAAETQVANFEQNVYDALNTVGLAENNLKNLIVQNRSDDLWAKSILPTDSIDIDIPNVALPEAMTAALSSRPELEQNDVAQAINDIDQRFFREQLKPQIDLVANVNFAGLAGAEQIGASPFGSNAGTQVKINEIIGRINQIDPTRPPIEQIPIVPTPGVPDNLTGGFFNSLTNIAALRYPTYRVGVQINLPFKSDIAKAQFGRSQVEAERLGTQREQLEQLIQVDVRNALQLVRTSQARLRSAAISRENSEQQYASEQRKLDAGQSTVFLVLERQTALTNARGSEIRAQTELNKAVADLQRATGNALRANNIVANIR
jgi:HAE1 family hydrophobic/amphiphilic exporter-1